MQTCLKLTTESLHSPIVQISQPENFRVVCETPNSAWPIHTGTWEALTVSCPPRCYSASWTAYFHVGPVLSSNKSFSRPGHPNQKPHQHRSYQRFAKFRLPFYGTMISAVRKARVFKKATCKRKDHCHDHEVRTERSGE